MSDTLSALAGAIPVVGGIVSSLIGGANTDSANQANRDFQEAQQQKQNEYNTKMWQMQNDYNSPASQQNRLRAAGLNPNLVYGQGSVVSAPAPQSARVEYTAQPKRAPDLGGLTAQGLQAYNATRMTDVQTNNVAAQTTNTIQDSVLKGVQAGLALANTQLAQSNVSKVAAEIPNIQSSTTKNLVSANVESMLAPYQADLASANTRKANADTAFKLDENVRQNLSNAMNLREAVARMRSMAIQNAKSQSEIGEINARVDTLLNSKQLQDMDISMRNQGIMPHDGVMSRFMGGLWNWLMPATHNSAGGMDRYMDDSSSWRPPSNQRSRGSNRSTENLNFNNY